MPDLKITNTQEAAEIDVKRFYIPGTTISSVCPKCHTRETRDLGDHYLMYPKLNTPFNYFFYCQNEDCQYEWSEKVILRVTLGTPPV